MKKIIGISLNGNEPFYVEYDNLKEMRSPSFSFIEDGIVKHKPSGKVIVTLVFTDKNIFNVALNHFLNSLKLPCLQKYSFINGDEDKLLIDIFSNIDDLKIIDFDLKMGS